VSTLEKLLYVWTWNQSLIIILDTVEDFYYLTPIYTPFPTYKWGSPRVLCDGKKHFIQERRGDDKILERLIFYSHKQIEILQAGGSILQRSRKDFWQFCLNLYSTSYFYYHKHGHKYSEQAYVSHYYYQTVTWSYIHCSKSIFDVRTITCLNG
jgi:hypothetical protein